MGVPTVASRRVWSITSAAAACAIAGTLALAAASSARADPAEDLCSTLSPSASFCIGLQKLAEAAAAECRRMGRPPSACNLPLTHQIAAGVTQSYQSSWLHRAAQFQYRIGSPLPFRQAQWLGTHNSFNSQQYSPTLSETDSNQQLSLSQQLDIDMRALELDVHWTSSANAGGEKAVVVCHARGPDQQNAGCTNERLLKQVLPEINGWLNAGAHRDQVVLLYLEDNLADPAGYAETVRELDAGLRRPDGSTLIYRPPRSRIGKKDCASLPLKLTRNAVRRHRARVVLVGDCQKGWASDVFGWDSNHVESGSTPEYRPFPVCDATYSRKIYDKELVRYFEDSTYLSAATDPSQTPAQAQADHLTPDKVTSMTGCGVNLFGFDQVLPNDGRIAASIWSWAKNRPRTRDGKCAVKRSDGRWETRPCTARRRPACRGTRSWKLAPQAVQYTDAWAACRAIGKRFDLPRTGYENSVLQRAAGKRVAWVRFRLP